MSSFTYPDLPLDGLLRTAAVRDPDGTAVRRADASAGFAELDDLADRVAAYLERETGRCGARIGVANVLDPVFAATYYGASRSGNTAVLINPLIKEDGLRHVLAAADVEVAFVPTPTAELLVKLKGALPRLRTVVVTDALDGVVPADALALHSVLDPVATPRGGRTDPDSVACIQFTTGSTGRPRGVLLTHRNLVANARQTALAHRLSAESVTLNHLPLYHLMHLNSAVYAGACQVLCQDADPIASLALAAEVGATHYYGLPARLHRLAADERLGTALPGGSRLTAVLSGGSALRADAARTLRERLGVPVIQGYGMAECSPLTHCQQPESYRPGAVGTTVPGTECRLVEPRTREPVDVWSTGEVQARGPQVMAGYLGEDRPARLDADGWFSTGDIGYLDDRGELHLTDRLVDVFKYDNEIVSPSLVERVISADPRVADCIVVDWPDPEHGALVWAGVVLRDPQPCGPYAPGARGAPGGLDVLDSITALANERLAHFERIRLVEALDEVPRTPTGKQERRGLRRQLKERAAERTGV